MAAASQNLLLLIATAALLAAGIALALFLHNRNSMVNRLKRFFGKDPRKFATTSRSFHGLDFPNLHRALLKFAEDRQSSYEIIGHGGYGLRHLSQYLTLPGSQCNAVQYESVDIGIDQRMQCPKNGIYLIDTDEGKYAFEVSIWYEGANNISLLVLSEDEKRSAAALEEIRELTCTTSVYRGKIISLEGQENTADVSCWLKVRFHEFAPVTREQIILPAETFELIERNVSSFYKHADRLKHAGKSLKRGILFYGKPGTGKTFTAKYLARHLESVTVLLLTGEQLWLIKEAFQLARLLAPSLVIMEDVDLIAHTRNEAAGQTVLHQLLNEMDGLTRDTEIIFLLTTNRPEILEPALSLRPGRIDQAIKFPLPDADCRRRLVEQYSQGCLLELADPARLLDRTDGASPAFIQELMRKAALIAAEEQEEADSASNNGDSRTAAAGEPGAMPGGDELVITDEHLQLALDELLLSGPLTRSLVGFHPPAAGS